MRAPIGTVLLLTLLLAACGAVESAQSDQAPATSAHASAAAPLAAPQASAASPAEPSIAPASAPAQAEPPNTAADASASAAAPDAATASSTTDSSAATGAGGPAAADGCPAEMPQVNPAAAALNATWNPDGTITVRGGLDVPSDAVVGLLVHQHGLPVGWALFGGNGAIDHPGPQIEATSTVPRADAKLYEDEEMLAGDIMEQNPYQPTAPVCIAVIVVPGAPQAASDDTDSSVLALVRLPVAGTAPADIVLQ